MRRVVRVLYAPASVQAQLLPPPLLATDPLVAASADGVTRMKIVLFEDDHLLAVYKPPGMLSQSGHDEGALSTDPDMLSFLTQHIPLSRGQRIGLVHRLDRPASGIMLFAKSAEVLAKLNLDFQNRQVEKSYVCVVNGAVTEAGICDNRVLKFPVDGRTKVVTAASKQRADAVPARLQYKPLLSINAELTKGMPQTLLAVRLETGRRHQIRAQLAQRDWPVCGDGKYGAPQNFATKDIALHSFGLAFAHPVTGKRTRIACLPPRVWERRFGAATMEALRRGVTAFEAQ